MSAELKNKLNKIIKTIFSVRNSCDRRHKVITILGLKLKIKKLNLKTIIEEYKIMHDKSLYIMGGGIPDGITLQLSFNNNCNCKCKFCAEDIAQKKEDVAIIPEKWLYEDLKELYPKTVNLVPTYGEITFLKEGYNYIKFIHENYPEINVFIESNGIAFDDKWAQLASDNLMRINFSVNALDEEHFKKTVWDRDGVFPVIQKNIHHYLDVLKEKNLFAFKPSISSVINESNYDTVEEFITYWISQGIQNIIIFFDIKENEVYSTNKVKDKTKVEEIVVKFLEMERIFAGKVDFGWQLFMPINNIDYFRNIVYAKDIEEIKAKYPKLVELIKDFDLKQLFIEKTNLRHQHHKKEYSYYDELSNVTFHQKIYNGKTICANPWSHIRLRPNGNFAVCSWVPYRCNIKDYIENDRINWEKVFNNKYYRTLRHNFKQGCYIDCMPNCPGLISMSEEDFKKLYHFDIVDNEN